MNTPNSPTPEQREDDKLFQDLKNNLGRYDKEEAKTQKNLRRDTEDLFDVNIEKGLLLFDLHIDLFYSKQELNYLFQSFIKKNKDNPTIVSFLYNKLEEKLYNFSNLNPKERQYLPLLFEDLMLINPMKGVELVEKHRDVFNYVQQMEQMKMKYLEQIIQNASPFQKDNTMEKLETIDNSIDVYYKPSDDLSILEKQNLKTILIIGETGVGKSTFINSFACFLLGIQMYNKERVKMVKEKSFTQTQSITSDIITYTIKPKENICKFPIRLIDTPGFGDTRGETKEQENINKLVDFLKNECSEIHAILFILKSSTNRLTPFQISIFNKMMNLFGKDAEQNFTVLFTFKDYGKSSALESIKETGLTFNAKFECNNAVFFDYIPSNRTLFNEYWKINMKNFIEILKFIETVKPTSIVLTKKMLILKKKFEILIDHLKQTIDELLEKVIVNEKEKNRLSDNKNNLGRQPDYLVEIEYENVLRKTDNWNVTCRTCHKTCHKNCVAVNMFLWGCDVFSLGKCLTCRHAWNEHVNDKFIYVRVKTEKKKEVKDYLKDNLNQMISTIESVVLALSKEIVEKKNTIFNLLRQCKNYEDYLKKISFKVQEMNLIEYLTLLIEQEKKDKKEGYEKKIQILNEFISKIDEYNNQPEAPNLFSVEEMEQLNKDDSMQQPQNDFIYNVTK